MEHANGGDRNAGPLGQPQKLVTQGAWRQHGRAEEQRQDHDRGHGRENQLDDDGPVTLTGLPRFDPPADPLKNLPPCAFTARWAQATSVSVSMRITYHIVGFINNLAQPFPNQTTTSAVQTWPVVRAEAVNAQGN